MTSDSEPELDPILQARVDQFSSLITQKLNIADEADNITTPLYHYTSADGLKGILQNQEIWLTSIFHLNDPSEHLHAIRLASEELKAISERYSCEEPLTYLCGRVQQFVDRDYSKLFGFFIASFSRSPDDLAQWRAYGDDGRGFAIGLPPKLFQIERNSRRGAAHEKVFVSSVIYDDAEARRRQRDALEFAVTAVLQMWGDADCQKLVCSERRQGFRFIERICWELTVLILWNSITTKHKAYKNEEEVRLIILGGLEYSDLPIETRVRSSDLVPFVRSRMPLHEKGNIVKIMIGPSSGRLAEDGVSNLLTSLGIDPTGLVVRSPIPYRSLK